MPVQRPGSGLPTLTHRLAVTDYDSARGSIVPSRLSPAPIETEGTIGRLSRGPRGDGEYRRGRDLNLDWAAHPAKAAAELNRSAVVLIIRHRRRHGWLYTLEQRREEEALVAYDVNTGTELWANTWKAEFRQPPNLGGLGPRSTPLWHEGKVYALGALGELQRGECRTGTRFGEQTH